MSTWDPALLAALLRGSVRVGEPMARHTTYRLGGPAAAFVEPADLGDLRACLAYCRDHGLGYLVVGEGSNLLVSDRGLPDTVVIHLSSGEFNRLEPRADHIVAGAGVPLRSLVALAKERGIASLVFMAGIPGTLGGALMMNAGTSAGDMASVVDWVDVMTSDGEVDRLPAEACGFGYRTSGFPEGGIVVRARLRVVPGDQAEVARRIDGYLARRRATQPVGRTAGCVFRNPPGGHAGRLIDQAGLKGLTVGAARVSEVHGNFVVAGRGARAEDVWNLARRVRDEVRARFQVDLELENVLVGPFGDGREPEEEP